MAKNSNLPDLARRGFIAALGAGAVLISKQALARDVNPDLMGQAIRALRRAQETKALNKAKAAAKGKTPAKAKTPPKPAPEPLRVDPLPYAPDKLAPYMSALSLGNHHGSVARDRLRQTRKLVRGTRYAKWSLDQIIEKSYQDRGGAIIFNQAASLFNHNFFFKCLKPKGGGAPPDKVADYLKRHFGSVEKFRRAFAETALSLFGSGWAWLYEYKGRPRLQAAPGALTPVAFGLKPVMALDMWEHAYYLDHQDKREKYLETFFNHLINWDFFAKNIA